MNVLLVVAIVLGVIGVVASVAARRETACDAPDEPWKSWDGQEPTELVVHLDPDQTDEDREQHGPVIVKAKRRNDGTGTVDFTSF